MVKLFGSRAVGSGKGFSQNFDQNSRGGQGGGKMADGSGKGPKGPPFCSKIAYFNHFKRLNSV